MKIFYNTFAVLAIFALISLGSIAEASRVSKPLDLDNDADDKVTVTSDDSSSNSNSNTNSVPEPSTLILIGSGVLSLAVIKRLTKKRTGIE